MAIKHYEKMITERYAIDRHTADMSMNFKNRKVSGFENINCQSESNFNASSEINMLMKSAKPIKYNFFESDDQYLKDNGFCVIDTFVGIYCPTMLLLLG